MNPDVKAKWVAAMKSGERKQGTRFLHFKDEFCCLGVLCDLAAKEGKGEWISCGEGTNYAFRDELGEIEGHYLPESIVIWSGLKSKRGRLPHPINRQFSLDGLNDKTGLSFKEIADIIEAQL